jgi:hypothetical protein
MPLCKKQNSPPMNNTVFLSNSLLKKNIHTSNTDTSKHDVLSHLMVSIFSEVSDYTLVEEPCAFFLKFSDIRVTLCWDPQLLPPTSFANVTYKHVCPNIFILKDLDIIIYLSIYLSVGVF